MRGQRRDDVLHHAVGEVLLLGGRPLKL